MLLVVCGNNKQEVDRVLGLAKELISDLVEGLVLMSYPSTESLVSAMDEDGIVPDIVLLDVDSGPCPRIDGAAALRGAGFSGIIILLSHTNDLAIPGYDVEAFNYVLKDDPSDRDRLRRVLIKATGKVRSGRRKTVLLNGISRHRSIPIDSIAYFSVDRHVCVCHFGRGETFEFVSSLDRIESMLMSYGFVRVHRARLVNMRVVEDVGYGWVVLSDGSRIPVGRSRQAEVRRTFDLLHSGDNIRPSDGDGVRGRNLT